MHPDEPPREAEPKRRPRLTPPIADVRRAVRGVLPSEGMVLVALSGGADSLALAAATAFEAHRSGVQAGAIIIDHGLQDDSAEVADRAARQARALGLDPVLCRRIDVPRGPSSQTGGLEAAARSARYAALASAARDVGSNHVVLGHTLDDQAETVILGLARGSGPTSMRGMARVEGIFVRPLLSIRRTTTRQSCIDSGLDFWDDPLNEDASFLRVRVRNRLMPVLERELGPGVTEALGRTAEMLREDSEVLDGIVHGRADQIVQREGEGITVPIGPLAAEPPALRYRLIRLVVGREFGVALQRNHSLAVSRLITDWHGQERVDLPGVRVFRRNGQLVFQPTGYEREAPHVG